MRLCQGNVILFPGEMKLRVLRDFNPEQMNHREYRAYYGVLKGHVYKPMNYTLGTILEKERFAAIMAPIKKICIEQSRRRQIKESAIHMRAGYDIVYDKESHGCDEDEREAFHAAALRVKRGDKLNTIFSATIG